MWQYVFLMLQRQPGKSALASSGFLLAACALILLSATTQTTLVRANQIISQNWRPTYDLAVLPPQAKVPTDQRIPSDLLTGYGGGISIQQYKQIQNLAGIEVAAPIAYVGYVQMPVPQIYFSDHSFPTGYYQLDWTLTAFNGQRHIVELQERDLIYIIFGSDSTTPAKDTSSTSSQPPDVLAVFDGQINEEIVETGNSPAPMSPNGTGTFLLAGIDPTAENQLVHLNKSISAGRMLAEQDTVHLDSRIPGNPYYYASLHKTIPTDAIPMLIHRQLSGQIMLSATLTLLYHGSMTADQILAKGGISYLQQRLDKQIMFTGTVPLVQNDPQRFSGHGLLWNGHTWQNYLPSSSNGLEPYYGLDFSTASAPAGLAYTHMTAPDGSAAYVLVPKGTQVGEGTFRTLTPLQTVKSTSTDIQQNPGGPDVFYNYEAVGEFTDNGLVAQINNPLNWLPENTYATPPVVLRYDAQGRPVTPTTLLPTTNPAGLIVQPPLALTTISAARELVGEHCISAIRVRVAGVVTPNQESWKHIQSVAQEIRLQTGLQVVVTLGSSPQPTLVYVPGVHAGTLGTDHPIAPVGWVEERWIHIGVGLTYLSQLGATRLLLLGAVLAVCLGYLTVAFSTLVSSQRRDFAVLSMLGWRPWQPILLFLIQSLILAIGGGIVGLGLALLMATFLGVVPLWFVVIWTIPLMLAFALISILYPLRQIWLVHPAELLRAGSSVSTGKTNLLGSRFEGMFMPIGTLVLRNLGSSRIRALIAVLSLFFSALLLMIMFNGVLALRQALQGTLLGDYVLFQTAVPQIAGCGIAMVLTFLSVAELLLQQVRERQKEIGLLQAVGWRPWTIQRLFVQEGLFLSIIGTVPGVLVSLWVLSTQHSTQKIVSVPLIACGVIVLMVMVAALAILPAMRAVSHMEVADLLRAE